MIQIVTISAEDSPLFEKSHYGPSNAVIGGLKPLPQRPAFRLGAILHSMATSHGDTHGGGTQRVGAQAGGQSPTEAMSVPDRWYNSHLKQPSGGWSFGQYPQEGKPHMDIVMSGADQLGTPDAMNELGIDNVSVEAVTLNLVGKGSAELPGLPARGKVKNFDRVTEHDGLSPVLRWHQFL